MITKDIIETIETYINSLNLNNLELNYKIDGFGNAKIMIDIIDNDAKLKEDLINNRISKRYGFPQNIVGMKFKGSSNRNYKIIGFKTSYRKYPIITECSDGKSYKHSPRYISEMLGGNNLINRNLNLVKLLKDG